MRTIERLSPTSLHIFESDREAFYLKYLSDARPPREPQSPAMAVGSSFDAFVKCALHRDLFGNDGGGEFDLRTLFETQVSNEEIRDWAWKAGQYVFECYKVYGCYHELLAELSTSKEDPRFEFALTGDINGVPFIGKPDMWYSSEVQVVLDWKVTGYCSKSASSPKKLYKSCRDCWREDRAKPTRGGGDPRPHKNYVEIDFHGHKIGQHFLEQADKKWADQIAIYSWLLGIPVGDTTLVTCIDQLCCKPAKDEGEPLIRVAQHRCRISPEFQLLLNERIQNCWAILQSGHIFDDLTREESDARCEVLDMEQTGEDDDFWAEVNRKEYRG